MSATSQPTDFSDLYTDLVNRVRSDSSVTATINLAKRYINIGLLDMHIGSSERFPWAEREAVLVTHPKDSWSGSPDGGLYCIQGQNGVSFTNAAGTTTLPVDTTQNAYGQDNVRQYGLVRISGDSEIYRLTVVSGATSFGDLGYFQNVYIGETTATETAFEYWEDEYALASDFLRPLDATRFSASAQPIRLIGRNKFRNEYPKNDTFGYPRVACLIDRPATGDTTPVRRIRFHPVPDTAVRIRYSYITNLLATASDGTGQTELVEDTDEPIVPIRYRMAIVYHALYSWYRDRGDDPTRAQLAKSQYDELISRVRSDVEVGQNRPRFSPAVHSYRRKASRPWGAGSGRFDRGGFDYGDD